MLGGGAPVATLRDGDKQIDIVMRLYAGHAAASVVNSRACAAVRAKALERLLIGSALFGVLGAGDEIPAYRLSGGSKLPGEPTLATTWKPVLHEVFAGIDDFIVDLRSGVYQNLGKVPGAVTAFPSAPAIQSRYRL